MQLIYNKRKKILVAQRGSKEKWRGRKREGIKGHGQIFVLMYTFTILSLVMVSCVHTFAELIEFYI